VALPTLARGPQQGDEGGTDLPGVRQTVAATRHLLEMYRRQLSDDKTDAAYSGSIGDSWISLNSSRTSQRRKSEERLAGQSKTHHTPANHGARASIRLAVWLESLYADTRERSKARNPSKLASRLQRQAMPPEAFTAFHALVQPHAEADEQGCNDGILLSAAHTSIMSRLAADLKSGEQLQYRYYFLTLPHVIQ